MSSPVAFPACRQAGLDHGAADIAGNGRCAPGSGPVSSGASGRQAAHGRTLDEDVPVRPDACALSQQGGKSITRCNRVCLRAGMAGRAAAIKLTSGNARQPDSRTLVAPYRAITVPNVRRRAVKPLIGWYNCTLKQKDHLQQHARKLCQTHHYGKFQLADCRHESERLNQIPRRARTRCLCGNCAASGDKLGVFPKQTSDKEVRDAERCRLPSHP